MTDGGSWDFGKILGNECAWKVEVSLRIDERICGDIGRG
jgi:hypothetical protein